MGPGTARIGNARTRRFQSTSRIGTADEAGSTVALFFVFGNVTIGVYAARSWTTQHGGYYWFDA